MNIEDVGNETFHDDEKSKRGCKPKANKQEYRFMVRFNKANNDRFLSLFRQSGMKSKSRLIADCVLNKTVKIITVNKSVMNHFYFQSFGEYQTLLEQFNVTAEEVKGEHNGKPYNGILYCITDEKENKLGRPFKSSLFGKEVGCDALQRHYELSKAAVEKKKIRENLRPVILRAMQKATSMEDFNQLIREKGIGMIVRKNEQGRIYGVTFIDYQNRTILNRALVWEKSSRQMVSMSYSITIQNKEVKQGRGLYVTNQDKRKTSIKTGVRNCLPVQSSVFLTRSSQVMIMRQKTLPKNWNTKRNFVERKLKGERKDGTIVG
ncbi:hypothetical protein EZS27_032146 [termite gut metagenome]|uniref:Uncharacterized protein n=1 Tax=termite gut metagenome TaxID=433724 RepID=A0A5J4Q714_9ZZZZ